MLLRRRCAFVLLLSMLVCLLVACDMLPSLTVSATPTATGNSAIIVQGTAQLNQWYKGGLGVEVRYEDWKSPGNNEDTVTIVRLNLRYVQLSVAYQPDSPLLLSEWMKKEHATAIINGGYFDQKNNATALVVSNGQVFGTSYTGFGGMLAVDSQGRVSLRSLHEQPYDPTVEQLQQATQSSPMLILPGRKRTQFQADAASSRRSVVAMDTQGRLLLIVSPNQAFSLDELDDLLISSDLSIDRALNLDGGASTGLYVNSGSQQVVVDSIAALPIVILVKAR